MPHKKNKNCKCGKLIWSHATSCNSCNRKLFHKINPNGDRNSGAWFGSYLQARC
jgi:hypothetical protein